MQVTHFPDARSFAEANWAELAHEPERNNVLLTVSTRAARYGDTAEGWAARENGKLLLAAFRTPPHYLLLSAGDMRAVRALAAAVKQDLPGVTGVAEIAGAFARGWKDEIGIAAELASEMTFYSTAAVADFTVPPGRIDVARVSEAHKLTELTVDAALAMSLPESERERAIIEPQIEHAIAEGRQFVWRDRGEIKSIARYSDGLEDCGARVGMVYTPPQFQHRGFGTAITGALTQRLLAGGQKWVCLFADDSNATSNGIYQRLGYRPRARFSSFAFL